MASPHMKRCSTSFVAREMQINTTVRYCFIPTRLAIGRKTDINNCWRECGEFNLEPSCIASRNVKWGSHFGTVWQQLKKLRAELPYDPAILHLGIYPGEMKHMSTQKHDTHTRQRYP